MLLSNYSQYIDISLMLSNTVHKTTQNIAISLMKMTFSFVALKVQVRARKATAQQSSTTEQTVVQYNLMAL